MNDFVAVVRVGQCRQIKFSRLGSLKTKGDRGSRSEKRGGGRHTTESGESGPVN